MAAITAPSAEPAKHSQTPPRKEDNRAMTDQTVPLQLLAAEWGTTVQALVNELGADGVLTDDLEIRHTTATDARTLLAQRKSRDARQRQEDEQRRAAMAAMQQPVLDRVAALQAKQHAQRVNGEIDANTPALVAMALGDPHTRLEAAGRRFDDMLNAGRRGEMGTMYRFNPEQEAQS
jgi:hypothetical protein